jgi:hypothetical protein
MANISSFKANMLAGGARSNQFQCIITFPAAVTGGALASNKVSFMAKSASIPDSTVADIEVMYRGRAVHFAGERTFQPWNISVYNDNDFALRNAFESWINIISNPDSTNGLMSPLDYQVDMEVHQLDRSDNVVKKYKFVDAYPTNVGEIQLSWDANSQLQEYPVSFSYNYHTTNF